MTDRWLDRYEALSLRTQVAVDELCSRYESALQAGAAPSLEAYLHESGVADTAAALAELLTLEVTYRRRRGERPSSSDYTGRFPAFAAVIAEVFAGGQAPTHIGSHRRAPALPQTPPTIDGYEVRGELGQSGMGVVLEGRDEEMGRGVAVKVLREEHRGRPELRRRFVEEGRITGRLQHPGVVPVYGLGRLADGRPYFTMKLVQGRTLAELLAGRAGPEQDRARLLKVFEQVCQALAYAHAQGVVHRDLKPANVMVGAFGEVQVMDWGLAKAVYSAPADAAGRPPADGGSATPTLCGAGGDTQVGTVLGTPGYMAPEQARGEADTLDARCDVFGLGAILCAILTGQPPFAGVDPAARARQAARGDLAEAFARLDGCGADAELVALARRCLAAEREDRPADAGALAAQLTAYLESVEARLRRAELERAQAEVKAAEGRKRLRVQLGAAAVLAVVLVLVTVASLLAAGNFNRLRLDEARARHEAEGAADEARRRGDAERWQRYRSNLAAARSALQLHSSGAARRALEAAPAEHRDWEWLHFTSRLDQARLVFSGSGPRAWRSGASVVTFRPDGKQVAADQEDGTVRVWDAATGRELGVLPGRGQVIRELGFSPDGRRLLVFYSDGTLQSWEPAAEDPQVLLRIPYEVTTGDVLSPDRRFLFGRKDHTGELWDVATGRKRADLPGRLHPTVSSAVVYSTDGRHLDYTTEDPDIHVWDLEAGAETHVLRGHTRAVRALAFSPDGKRLASGSMYPDNSARLWDVTTGKEIAVLRSHRNEVASVAFSRDGTRLATASLDQTARLWDGVTGREIAALQGHRGPVVHAAFRPDGRRLATSSYDGTLRVWDPAAGDPVAVLHGHAGQVSHSVFRPDGALLASASTDGTVRLWDMALAERSGVLRGHTSYVYDVAFSPDGTRAASAAWDGTVRLWDPTSCLPTGPPLPAGGDELIVTGVCFRADGKQLASVSSDHHVRVWDAASGKLLRKLRCPSGDWKLYPRAAFDPTGTTLAAGGTDGLIRLWGAEGDEPIATLAGHQETVGDVAFRPDGAQLASGGLDRTVRLWDVVRRRPAAVLRGHGGAVTRVSYSADGGLLASASEDKTVRLWDAVTGEALAVLPHGSIVYGVAFSPDGTRLAAGCADNTIRLWDVGVAGRGGGKEAPDAEVAELRGHDAYVHAVAWSHDGTRLISGSGDFTVRIWDALSAQERTKQTPANAPK